MNKFYGIVKTRSNGFKVAVVIAALVLLYINIVQKQYIFIPIVILVFLAAFFKKEYIFDEKGVDIKHMLFGGTVHNYWTWNEVTTLHVDYRKARPNVMIHIGKDVVTRSFTVVPDDVEPILELAESKNSNIYIVNITPEEQERLDEEEFRRQEIARAQQAAKKRKKK